ncbi:MAG: EAL domain-containing protein [Pseudomonadota bacterium]
MNVENESFVAGLVKWDVLLGQRVLDTISFLVPAFLFSAFALSPKASDLQNALVHFGLLSFFLLGSGVRLVSGWNRLRSYRFQIGSALFDIGCLYAFLTILPLAYGSPFAISLKAPTANLLYVFIIARVVLFDIRLVAWTGISAAIGWVGLTILSIVDAGSPGITREFAEYTMSGKILIGAQVEHVISILLVTVVSVAVVNAYQRDGLTGLRKKRDFVEAFKRRLPGRIKTERTALISIQIEDWHALANENKSAANTAIKDVAAAVLRAPVPHILAAKYESDTIILWKRCAEDDSAFRHHLELLKQYADEQIVSTKVAVKIGAARVQESGETTLRNLERALDFAADQAHKIQIFDSEFETWITRQNELIAKLDTAAEDGLLVVQHQPIIDMMTNSLAGTEALVRLKDEEGGFISPAEFIPLAEKTGAIDKIGAYVLDTASQDHARLCQSSPHADFFVSVNVAPQQIHAWTRLEASVAKAIALGTNLKLEVTESSAAQDGGMLPKLDRLGAFGAKLAIDDFGTGYSSLERLGDLPFDTLKIDIAFTRKIGTDAGYAMIDAIVRMAKATGMDVIIEGIETTEQHALAMKAGIRYGQGFYFSRPVCVDEILSLAADQTQTTETRASA